MLIKTSDLTGVALDWAVAKAEGRRIESPNGGVYWPELCHFSPSTTWLQCGVIIGREKITIDTEHGDSWRARFSKVRVTFDGRAHHYHHMEGLTPLIAVCRCFVASNLGDEVEVPEELTND